MISHEIQTLIDNLVVDQVQTFESVAVAPLLGPPDTGPEYVMAHHALKQGWLEITEVSTHGAVPHLKAINHGPTPVLLLDGEQLVGAKQDRVINTTILLPARSETIIPVSCTERGRWHWVSPSLQPADFVMFFTGRAHKAQSVTESLAHDEGFVADQAGVWDDVAGLQFRARVESPTDALRDVVASFEQRAAQFIKALEPLPGQTGLLVFWNGRVVGADCLSRPDAYAAVHDRLLRSYVLEPLLTREGHGATRTDYHARAREFLAKVGACSVKVYPSPGCGEDCRLVGDGVTGSALIHGGRVVHLAAFASEQPRSKAARRPRWRRPRI